MKLPQRRSRIAWIKALKGAEGSTGAIIGVKRMSMRYRLLRRCKTTSCGTLRTKRSFKVSKRTWP
jgi:hypothetical protein